MTKRDYSTAQHRGLGMWWGVRAHRLGSSKRSWNRFCFGRRAAMSWIFSSTASSWMRFNGPDGGAPSSYSAMRCQAAHGWQEETPAKGVRSAVAIDIRAMQLWMPMAHPLVSATRLYEPSKMSPGMWNAQQKSCSHSNCKGAQEE